MKSRRVIVLLGILTMTCVGILIALLFQYKKMINIQNTELINDLDKEFDYHCAFIVNEPEDPFWSSIYEGAREEGIEKKIYVENYGQKLSLNYSINDRLKMAIAASVDAIIIEGNDEASTTNLINKAIDQGIVVVTAYQDQIQSKRRSFIGVNKFEIGYKMCSLAYNYLTKENEEIMILYDKNSEVNPENTILNSGIKKFLKERSSKVKINSQLIDSTETYNTEERIRELLRNKSTRPRVLICTNLIQTQCAYQTVVDLNCVGDVKILGFYSTQSILEAIDSQVIEATLMVDTYKLGMKALDCVAEFLDVGYVSDYIAVDTYIIDREEARQQLILQNETASENP